MTKVFRRDSWWLGIVVTALVVGSISGCNKESPEANQTESQARLISGIDLNGITKNVRAQDDFFTHANGAWFDSTEIPSDKSSWGSFNILHEQSLEQLRAIVEELTDTSTPVGESATGKNGDSTDASEKVAAFYTAWLNEEEIEQRQLAPLAAELKAIDEATSHADIITLFAQFNAVGVDSPINFWIGQDDKDSTRYTVFLDQSGLGLPDRDYYFDDSERGREILEQYRSFVIRVLSLAGIEDAEQAAQRIISLETQLAEHQWNKVDNRDSEKTYNPRAITELRQLLSDYHLDSLLAGVGLDGQEQFILRQPSYADALNHLLPQIDMDTWRDYLRFHVLVSFAPYLNQPFEQAHFNFYYRTLSGQPEQELRWKRAIASINDHMGELLGQLYVARHFPPEAKTRMVELVDGLIAAYQSSINELEWMGPDTRQKALAKLAMFTPKIGYPDQWKDYSNLAIDARDLVGNIKRARAFNHQFQINKLGQPVDRSEWFMAPQRVNAYYNPGLNEIVFPAAILQPPFFNMTADDAVNYGAIGAVIGHEIGHGFDDQGSKYTGEGNLENWWTQADRTAFEQRTAQLVDQYAAYEPLPGLRLNGELTLGENIGDLGGLSIALEAYQQSLQGKAAPVIDGFTGEQRVFMGWAQAWRVKRRDELTERLIKTDPHSPPKYRVNGVLPNIDAFYSAFDVKPGDKMYLPPEQRVKIW